MNFSGNKNKIRNWYTDKYIVASIQRNILFVITIFLAIGILFCLILIKYVYENRSVEPYLIEINKNTGEATIVNSQTVRQFTASEVIKESNIIKYIKVREGYNQETYNDDKNLIRVLSAKDAYKYYSNNRNKMAISELDSKIERGAKVVVNIRSILFTSPKTAEVNITKNIIFNGITIRKKYFKIRIIFDFFDLNLPLEDRYLNPLGFQTVSYDAMEEKVGINYDPDKQEVMEENKNPTSDEVDNNINNEAINKETKQ